MKERDTPLRLVRLWPKRFADCYERMDYMHRGKADGALWWPDYCPMPISSAYVILNTLYGVDERTTAAYAAELTACWLWRQDKIIYAFDSDLSSALAAQAEDTEDTDVLPMDLLLHPPYPCIYIKGPALKDDFDGFFTWVEWDENRKMAELRVQLVTTDFADSIPQMLHLIPGATIGDCLADTMRVSVEHLDGPMELSKDLRKTYHTLLVAIQHILYLTAVNADVTDEPAPSLTVVPPRAPGKKRTERTIQDKAGEVTAKQVGVRVGAALRAAAKKKPSGQSTSTGTGSRKRAHTRRGHWHHYWTGPRDGERELILKWVSPTVIHPDEGRPDNVTVFPVR